MTRLRGVALVVVACVGLVVGVFSVLAASDAIGGPAETLEDTSIISPTSTPASTTSEVPRASTPPEGTSEPAAEAINSDVRSGVLMAWTSGGLPPGFADAVAAMGVVEYSTAVAGDQAELVGSRRADGTVVDAPAPGWVIPLDTLAVQPGTYSLFVDSPDDATLSALRPGEALLTESSMTLRGLDVGSTIELSAGPVQVVGVIGDFSGAGAELIVHIDDAQRLGVATPRHVLLKFTPGARRELTETMAALAGNRSIRFRTPNETTWLRYGDAVAPLLLIKREFGEFAYRDRAGRNAELDPGWVKEHIVSAEVPILGTVRCHRLMIEPLATALGAIEAANLAHLVDPGGYAGCWSPRRIGESLPLSRHAWGIAVDLNIGANPRGSFSTQDHRLIEAMSDVGLANGGLWLVPDPGHYEIEVDL